LTFERKLFHPDASKPKVGLLMPIRSSGFVGRAQPIRLLHLLDGLLAQEGLFARGSGVVLRRQRQRLALTQRLLDPLPPHLISSNRNEMMFWRGLRWGTPGLLLAWWLRS
jgi:hypothetical protein